jgi:outer membrane lipoprotein-sorting protein
MAEMHEPESEFARLLQRLPFEDAPRPEHAERLRQQVLARFDEGERAASATPWWKHALNQGREIMRHPLPRLTFGATAVAAVLALAWLFFGRQSTAQAVSRFAEAFVQAKTAHFQMEVQVEGQNKQKFQAWYLAPGKFRQEIGPVTNISDFATGKIVSVMPALKKVMIMNITGVPKDKRCDNYFEQVRDLLSGIRDGKGRQIENLGEKEVEGKKAVGFRIDSPAATVTLWGDPKTGLPVRIESVWSGLPRTECAMSHFEFNVALKESLFDLTPPAGYKVQSIDVDASEPQENTLVQAFQACSDISGGEFPEALNTAGITKLIIKYTLSQGKNLSDDKMRDLMKESIKIGRGFQFALSLPESADAHYAGKGVKRGDKDRPIFWYKPEGAKHYRVLDANLTWHDAQNAPQVAGAVRIEKASKTTRRSAEK